ncbi:unnamed protein product [Allacma fusca]|uniref:Uncharacterized protein n=1 Tax=Allacma fusca TaxID=39272 RepID=A0A8J2L4D7_9HEXA|nr:unnamed protein product [Allacma fusca]
MSRGSSNDIQATDRSVLAHGFLSFFTTVSVSLVCQHPSSITVSTRPAAQHTEGLPPLSESEPSTTSGMANVRRPCDAPPLSNRTTELMSASIRKGIQKSYRSAWKSL